MKFYPLENTANLTEGYLQRFKIDGKDLLLVCSGGQTRLIPNRCPHDGAPLKKAKLTNGCIQCPKHRISFDLKSGKPIGGEAVIDVSPLTHYELIEEGDQLGVLIK